MIPVKITLPLNIRRGPGTDFVLLGTIRPSGQIIDMDGVEEGENYKGVNKWYYKFNSKKEKQWYWGGRVSDTSVKESLPTEAVAKALAFAANAFAATVTATATPEVKSDFRQWVKHLDKSWLNTKGKDTTVVIIDTGVSVDDEFFNENLIREVDFTGKDGDDKSHATFIAGIIAGTEGPVKGIASSANILSLMYKDNNTLLAGLFDNLIAALKEVVKQKNANPQKSFIVNLSQGFREKQYSKHPDKKNEIETLIKELTTLNVPIFCAAGEDSTNTDGKLLFPALMDETIAVGCISQENIGLNISGSVTIVTPLMDYHSYNASHTVVPNRGSSFSLAFCTSLAANYFSANKQASPKAFLEELRTAETKRDQFDYNKPQYQFSFI
jgi:hypothetical protein